MDNLPQRILNKIHVAESGCWLWLGWTEKREPGKLSYGKVWWDGKMRIAHRVIYILLVGEIPPGKQIDHLCRNPSCVNPEHMEPVTAKENVRRGNTGQNMVERITCFCGECKTCRQREYQRKHRAKRM